MLNLETIKEIDISNLEYNDIYYDKKIYKRAYPICIEKYNNLILLTDVVDKENVNTTEIGNGRILKIDLINREILSRKAKLDIKRGKYVCNPRNTIVEYPEITKLQRSSELYKIFIPDITSKFERTIFNVISKDSANLILMNAWENPSMKWYVDRIDVFKLLDDHNSNDNSVLDYLNRCGPVKLFNKVQNILWTFSFDKTDCIQRIYGNLFFNKDEDNIESKLKIIFDNMKFNKNVSVILPRYSTDGMSEKDVASLYASKKNLMSFIEEENIDYIIKGNRNLFCEWEPLFNSVSRDHKKLLNDFITRLRGECQYSKYTLIYNLKTVMNYADGSSKKLEEFLDYYKYLKESYLIKRELINGDVCNDRQLIEYLDYMRHALAIRESGIKLPLFSKNVMLMMENGFSIRNDEYCEDFGTSNYKLKYAYSKTTMNHVFGDEYNEPLNLGKYTISLPQCEIDFINEGYELNHCASTYYDIVCDGESLVFFLRDSSKPEEPLYTIETDTRFTRIIQVSGKFNVDLNPYTDEPACLALVDFCKRFFLDFSNLKYFDKFLDNK